MDFIFDNIFIIILLFVGAISQWLKARSEARQNQDTGYDPSDYEEMAEEAERRRSLPAVPPPLRPGSVPPPLPPTALPHPTGGKVAPAPAMRRKSREPEPAPTAYDTSSELARQQELADRLKEMKRSRSARQANQATPPGKRAATAAVPATGVSLRSRLANRLEVRKAFVLKEILDRPVGLR